MLTNGKKTKNSHLHEKKGASAAKQETRAKGSQKKKPKRKKGRHFAGTVYAAHERKWGGK